MSVNVTTTKLAGLLLLEPRVFPDGRGFFLESYREDALASFGVREQWVQDNHSRSTRGVLRGLHWSVEPGQAKLVRCARGQILDVVVDLRAGSPTFGRWEDFDLDDVTGRALYVPVGFAHGFWVRSEVADVVYKCSQYYDGAKERNLRWDDPDVGIVWPEGERLLSDRDREAPLLANIAPSDLPEAAADSPA